MRDFTSSNQLMTTFGLGLVGGVSHASPPRRLITHS